MMIERLAKLATWTTLAASVLGFLGDGWWALDLFAHFRVHYLLAALPAAGYLLWRKRWRWGLAASLVVALNAGFLAPLYFGADAKGERTLKVLVVNVNSANQNFAAVAKWIRKTDPDVVGLVEVNDRWLRELSPALGLHLYRSAQTRDDNFGLALYSKHPLMLDDVVPQPITGFPTVRAVAEVGEERVQFALLHLPPPMSARWFDAGQQHLRQFINMRADSKGRFVLLGDFNATPWSASFRRLMRAGLRRAGTGLRPTWPSRLGPFGIPIDHVLLDGPIDARSVEVGPDVGSDHRPLLVTLTF